MPTLEPRDDMDCDAVVLQLIAMCRESLAADDLATVDSLLTAIGSRVATIMVERPTAQRPVEITTGVWSVTP